MKVRGNIKPLVVGMAVGLIPAVIMATTSFTGTDQIDGYQPKWDTSFWSYEGGVVDDKSERYYQRGNDWIMIKDFPEIIDNYAGHYQLNTDLQNMSDITWAK